MRRASIERGRTLRVWRKHNGYVHDGEATSCRCDDQPGRFRKSQRFAGCGRVRCHICQFEKLFSIPDLQQRRADVSYREWLAELGL